MGIASLVLGIISLIAGWIPFICFIAFVLAIVGLILGIVDTVKKNKTGDKKRGISIAGLIISAVAIPIIVFSSIVSFILFAVALEENNYYQEDYDWNYHYDNYDYDDWYQDYYNTIDYHIYEML